MWFVLSPVLKTEGYPISGSELSMRMVVLESGSGQYPKGLVAILEVSFKLSEP